MNQKLKREPIDNMYMDLMKFFRNLPNAELLLPKDVLKLLQTAYINNSPDGAGAAHEENAESCEDDE
jgi:hypothetical protein